MLAVCSILMCVNCLTQCFDDRHTLFQIHINCALLAIAEKDSQSAIFSLVKALVRVVVCGETHNVQISALAY